MQSILVCATELPDTAVHVHIATTSFSDSVRLPLWSTTRQQGGGGGAIAYSVCVMGGKKKVSRPDIGIMNMSLYEYTIRLKISKVK